jgi:chorismate mutase
MGGESLEALRDRIRQLDQDLIALAADRVAVARQIGEAKRRDDRPLVDYAQERVVLERARTAAEAAGLDPRVAETILVALIRAAVSAQDQDSWRRASVGQGKTAVVVGGLGRMGRWFTRFLADQGYAVGASILIRPETNTTGRAALCRRLIWWSVRFRRPPQRRCTRAGSRSLLAASSWTSRVSRRR